MLGALAYITKSIRPGIAVHAIGLVTFFGLVWPYDKARPLVAQHGADIWFQLHVGQTVVFAALSVLAFIRLAKLAKQTRLAM
jgi:hypothetical protein